MKDFDDIPFEELAYLKPVVESSTSQSRTKRVHDPELSFDDKTVKTLFEHVVKSPQGCWLWVGSISSPDGYGRFTWQRGNRQRTVAAHRFALLITGESFGPGEVAEHECNEPLCVRVGYPVHSVVDMLKRIAPLGIESVCFGEQDLQMQPERLVVGNRGGLAYLSRSGCGFCAPFILVVVSSAGEGLVPPPDSSIAPLA
ncbi:hypothetical protein [uncultured Corynebacterium sp.]|uniref:hypothetical protein n=1 Tax=uncultured Corynebacterium sp. TaxID=159447 RepID=UPI00288BD47B|nr:hypothetical protein [uncultured Corynebacterium sp.]